MTVVLPESETRGEIADKKEIHKIPYPIAVVFIAVTEFCERFSYYGMRAVLTIYMRNVLNYSENFATTIYHVFLLLCYGLPVLGGILADSFLGKYRTILYISIVYAVGNFILSAASVTPLHLPQVSLSMLGLFLMAVGTGGIKPCVVALGAEQFVVPAQEKQLGQFFSIFYFVVSIGSMLSTVITPVFRRDVTCFGDATCYPLAFGVPGSLMIVAIGVFVCGKRRYKIVQPDGNIIVKVVKCITYALKEESKHKGKPTEKKGHWLDYARNKYDASLVNDTKGLLRILVYYLPVPMFFALYEQLGSRWTLQATRMDGLVGGYTIKPDQMQVTNAILMFIFIPFSETILYPILRKCNIFRRPLQRMCVGGVLAAVSFLVAGLVEKQIESSFALVPTLGDTHVNFINTLPCPIIISENYNASANDFLGNKTFDDKYRTLGSDHQVIIKAGENYVASSLKTFQPLEITVQVENGICSNISWHPWNGHVTPVKDSFQSFVISSSANASLALASLPTPDDIRKSREGNAKLRILLKDLGSSTNASTSFGIQLVSKHGEGRTLIMYSTNDSIFQFSPSISVDPGRFRIIKTIESSSEEPLSDWFDLNVGGNYILVINRNGNSSELSNETKLVTIVPPNSIHMLWLIPQYFIMVMAEILFMISGCEFSFTEAPASMKSVVQSCWHLTNAAGNAIVIVFAQFTIGQATEYFMFAALMGVDIIIFTLMAIRYKYVNDGMEPEKKIPELMNSEKLEESKL